MTSKAMEATFVKSSVDYRDCPETDKPEIAFAGRSNVGKSSLINMLLNKKNLAKTSGTPGKTLQINHFNINDQWYLVDLPGYGYAKVSKKIRENLDGMIRNYLMHRHNMYGVMLLIDSRHPMQPNDLELMTWLGEHGIPFAIIFTKADKPGSASLNKNLAAYKNELLKTWEVLPDIFVTSSLHKSGRDELLDYLHQVIFDKLSHTK